MLASLPLCLVGWCWSVGWGISLLNIASDNKIFVFFNVSNNNKIFLLNIANNKKISLVNIASDNKISLLNIANDNKIQYDLTLVHANMSNSAEWV